PFGPTSLAYSLWESVVISAPAPPDFNIKAYGFKEKNTNTVHLTWEPTEDPFIEVYVNGKYYARWYNDGRYSLTTRGKGNDVFQICEINYDNCSASVIANFEDTGDFQPNIAPVADFQYSVDGLQVQFTDTSTDADGTIESWTWYFGDGKYTTQQHPIYTYAQPGTYKVDLILGDNFHEGGYITKYISVGAIDGNFPPTADFSYLTNDLEVQFIDSSSDSDGTITSWSWDFGDGNSSTSSNPKHIYTDKGTYNVSLQVTDNEGAATSFSREVKVNINESNPGHITLTARGYKVKGAWHTDLSWTPAGTSSKIEIYREGYAQIRIDNTGTYTDITNFKGGGSLTYKVCEDGTTNCSKDVTVQF